MESEEDDFMQFLSFYDKDGLQKGKNNSVDSMKQIGQNQASNIVDPCQI